MIKCKLCKHAPFKTWAQYDHHHKRIHGTTDETGVPRMDLTAALNQARVYVPMAPADKQMEVARGERTIREAAWHAGKLNPLIGFDKVSSEPVWDTERNIVCDTE